MIIEKWKNAQTYVIGKYHIKNNLPCQDRTFYFEKNGVKVMTLADGAGSQPKSHFGAELVCVETCKLLTEYFDEFLMYFEYQFSDPDKHIEMMAQLSKLITSYLINKLKKKALELNAPIKELSSTLLFFAIKGNHYLMGHIGDGIIAGLYSENNSKRMKLLSGAENGAAANITFFVPDSDSNEHLRLDFGRIENLVGVIMSSDGAADVLFSKNGIDDSTYQLFEKFSMLTSEEYHDILSEYLTKVISNYSTDDLSLNILSLEDNDTSKLNDKYIEYILDDISSSNQIIRKSQYCYYLDPSIETSKTEFNNVSDVRRYLKWN